MIFDLGKVLVDFDYTIAAKKIAARSAKAPGDLHAFLGASPILVEYESGRLTRQEFFNAISQEIQFRGDVVEFGNYFADIFTAMPDTIALLGELRAKGYKTYIFSNTNDLAIEHVRRNFPFFKNFDGYVMSFEVGGMKPQDKIYQAMEKMTGKTGADLVYIDDRPENIEAGAARNWRAVLHQSGEQTRRKLAGWNLI